MKAYFADLYSPWQRSTNENTNGRLRHYFPKGIDWRKVTDLILATVVEKLNNQSRKCLNYQTPNEVFLKSIGDTFTTCNPHCARAASPHHHFIRRRPHSTLANGRQRASSLLLSADARFSLTHPESALPPPMGSSAYKFRR